MWLNHCHNGSHHRGNTNWAGGGETIGINDRELENIVLASRSASSKGPAS